MNVIFTASRRQTIDIAQGPRAGVLRGPAAIYAGCSAAAGQAAVAAAEGA